MNEKNTSKPEDQRGADTAVERMLRRLHNSNEFPGVSKCISAINEKLSSNPDSFDASELAGLILNDYGLTTKLIRLANSVTYGFAAGKVTTVTRAVVVLGYVYVRLVSVSLFLFEHFKSKHFGAHLKEEILRSLWSGMLAREIAIKIGNMDAEEAFICAMLIRLGKLTMIRHFPKEYRKILALIKNQGRKEAKAVMSVCATTYDELGMAVAKYWNFPDEICNNLQPLAVADLNRKGKAHPKLLVLNSFMRELNKLVERNTINDHHPSVKKLLKRYSKTINISEQQLHGLIRASVTIVDQHAQAMDFDTESSPFLCNLRVKPELNMASHGRAENQLSVGCPSESFQFTDGMVPKAGTDEQSEVQPIDALLDGIQIISQAIINGDDVNAIATKSLDVLFRSLAFQRALMFVRDGFNQVMTVRSGCGRQSRKMVDRIHFKINDAGDFFNHAIQSGKDLIVADAYDPEIKHLVPKWYRNHIDEPAFIFFPVSVQKVTIGALYADRPEEGPPITAMEHRYLDMLRNQLALAIRCQQQSVQEIVP